MRAVIQRVTSASVSIQNQIQGSIDHGLVVLLGIAENDTEKDLHWLCKKIVQMRLFADAEGKMNLSVQDVKGNLLLISQFTLLADVQKGNRPSFVKAARPEQAIPLYQQAIALLQEAMGKPIATGIFGADMQVNLTNNGPVTIVLDSKTA